MKPKNKYHRRSRISEAKFRELLRYFALDLEATKIVVLTGLSKNTVHRYLQCMRQMIAEECERQSPLAGDVEVDESYFGPRRVRGKKGRGAGGKTIVFGIYKRNGKVYTRIIPNVGRKAIQDIITGKITKDSIIHSDSWHAYAGLVDLGYRKHYRIDHARNEFANRRTHINGIENFWGLAKVRLVRFRGIHKSTFYLHLKEYEFRFNHRNDNLYQVLLHFFRKHPLNWE